MYSTNTYQMKKNTKKPDKQGPAFACRTTDGLDDTSLHAEMMPAGSLASDEIAIRLFEKNGMSRADARRLISSGRGYGG